MRRMAEHLFGSESVREAARNFRETLEEGRQDGASVQILREMVREAPLASVAVAFLIGMLSRGGKAALAEKLTSCTNTSASA
jgi:alpha-D-ribose 1-methylphosphonate 5-triphosphate synthase subunit PhnH